MYILYVAADPELPPGFYVDMPEQGGLCGPYETDEIARDSVFELLGYEK